MLVLKLLRLFRGLPYKSTQASFENIFEMTYLDFPTHFLFKIYWDPLAIMSGKTILVPLASVLS
jgi:hypothetical protein